MFIVDADSPLVRAARPVHQPGAGRRTATGCPGSRRSTASRCGCSTATRRPVQRRPASSAATARRRAPHKALFEWTTTRSTSAPTTRRCASRCSTSAASTPRSSSRARSASAARTSAWSTTRRSCRAGHRDLQRRHGRDPGRLGQPPAAAAADAGVGRRRLRRRGQAGRRARRPRRQHDLRPAGPRRPRPRQPGLGPVLGGVHRAAAAGALPHRRQRHRHDVLREVPVGVARRRTPSSPSAARCCSSATPGSSPT